MAERGATTAENLEERFDAGTDVFDYFDLSRAARVNRAVSGIIQARHGSNHSDHREAVPMSTTVEMKVRADKETRKRFAEVAEDLGMDTGTALGVLMRQFVKQGGFPSGLVTQAEYVPTEKEFAEEMNRRWERIKAGHFVQHELVEV